jgi:hypothetical protein
MAENKEEAKLFTQLYSKLTEVMGTAGPHAEPGQDYLALQAPGIPVNVKAEPEGKNVNQNAAWSAVLNKVPRLNWVYTPSGLLASDVYKDIVENHRYAKVELTETEKKELEEAQKLYKATRDEYKRYAGAYRVVLAQYENARATAENTGEEMPHHFTEELNEARAEWATEGHKAEHERAGAVIEQLQQNDPATWWNTLAERLRNARLEAKSGPFWPASTYPEYPFLIGEEGWAQFSFKQKDFEHQEESSLVKAGGSLGFEGIFSLGAEYSDEHKQWSTNSTDIELTAELKRAEILRPWFDGNVLRAHTWTFAGPMEGSTVSQGNVFPAAKEDTLMPLLPTGILLARNVVLKADFSSEDEKFMHEKLAAKGDLGWGPFSISASYLEEEEKRSFTSHLSEGELKIEGQQLIGFFCDVVPLCPSMPTQFDV